MRFHRSILKDVVFALLLFLCLTPCADAKTVTFPLVLDGKPVASVVYTGDQEDLVASVGDLNAYVKRISGADLDIRKQAADLPGPTLHLGETEHFPKTAGVHEGIKLDGFALVPVGEDLVIAGDLPQGTSNGVMTVLQDQFGVRWYWAGAEWEFVPESKDLVIKFDTDSGSDGLVNNPTFLRRAYWSDNRTMARRMRTTLPDVEFEFQGTSHDMGRVVPDSLFGEHPDYFALWNGKRTTDGVCYTHPDMFDLFMKYVRNGGRAFGLKDNGVVCQCERCNAVHKGSHRYNDYYNTSDSYFPLMARVAKQTAKEFPGVHLGTFVYQQTNMPPRGVDYLADNLDITLCIDTAQQFDPEYKKLDREIVAKWPKLVGRTSFYDYLGLGYWTPRYCPGLMADGMKYAAEQGVMGYFSHTGAMICSAMPMYYCYSRLMWDKDFDYRAGIEEMMNNLYGEAAEPMSEFYQLWEDCWMRPRDQVPVDLPWRDEKNEAKWLYGIDDFFGEMRIYCEADFDRAEAILLKAKEIAKNKDVKGRVHNIWFDHRFSYLAAKTYYEAQRALYTDPETAHGAYVQSASVNEVFRNFVFYYDFIRQRPYNTATDWPGKPFYVRCWGLRAMLRDAVLAPFVRWSVANEGKIDPYDLHRFERAAAFQASWNRTDIEAQMAKNVYAQERRPRADGLLVSEIPHIDGSKPDWNSIPEFSAAPWLYEARPENPERGKYDDPHKYFYIDPPTPEDHLIRGQAAWSDDVLYLRFSVTDDVHRQTQSGENLKRGDSIRVMLVPDRNNYQYSEHSWTYIWGGYHGTELDFVTGLTQSGVQSYVVESPEDLEDEEAGSLVKTAISRDGDTTLYEISVDWSAVPDFKVEEEKSIGIIVNGADDDGDVLQVAEYGSGVTYRQRPSECSAFRLID